MPATVVCPQCWTWSELRKNNRCKRCKVPLMYPDGSAIPGADSPPKFNALTAGGSRPITSDGPHFFTPLPSAPAGFTGSSTYAMAPGGAKSLDWVAVARWISVGYGALLVVGSLALGLFLRHITFSFTDPSTGELTTQTYDVATLCVVLAFVFALATALFAWLTKFTAARIIFLLLTGAAVLRALEQMSTEPPAYAIGTVIALLLDVAYGGVLVMSFLAPRRLR